MGDGTPAREPILAEQWAVSLKTCATSIVNPNVTAPSFEINPAYIRMIQEDQFSGAPNEDPCEQMTKFLSILDLFKVDGLTDEGKQLRMFPFSLKGEARNWLRSQPHGSFTTWDKLAKSFINKYFPPEKQAKLRQAINGFIQQDDELVYDAWERFYQLLKKCPTHGLPEWMQIRLFYDGLTMYSRNMVDASAGGSLKKKTLSKARQLIERMSHTSSHFSSEKEVMR